MFTRLTCKALIVSGGRSWPGPAWPRAKRDMRDTRTTLELQALVKNYAQLNFIRENQREINYELKAMNLVKLRTTHLWPICSNIVPTHGLRLCILLTSVVRFLRLRTRARLFHVISDIISGLGACRDVAGLCNAAGRDFGQTFGARCRSLARPFLHHRQNPAVPQHRLVADRQQLQRLQDLQKTEHTHTHPFNGPLSGTTRVSRYQKGKTDLDFTEARDSEWQWHRLGHMQVCTSLQTDNHASTPPLSFLQTGCPSCRRTNSVKALKTEKQKTVINCQCHKTTAMATTLLYTQATISAHQNTAVAFSALTVLVGRQEEHPACKN